MSAPRMHREINYDEAGAVKMNQTVDEILKENSAYQYLCHVEEVRNWLKLVSQEKFDIPQDSIIAFENSLRNGVIMAKLACIVFPEKFKEANIFDSTLKIYGSKGLVFRHIDNINTYYRLLEAAELPPVFFPVTTDIYDRKNMPKLIYSIHALAMLLYRKGLIKVKIGDIFGKIQFDQEELSQIQQEFDALNISMPQFGKIGGILAKEVKRDEAKRFACIVKINDSIDNKDAESLISSLSDPICELDDVKEEIKEGYLTLLSVAKNKKIENNRTLIDDTPLEELDYFVKNLSFDEIQEIIVEGNLKNILHNLDKAILNENLDRMVECLREPILKLNRTILIDHLATYMKRLKEAHQKISGDAENQNDYGGYALDTNDVSEAIGLANSDIEAAIRLSNALQNLDQAIDSHNKETLMEALHDEELKLDNVNEQNADAYCEKLAEYRHKSERDEILNVNEVQKVLNEVNGIVDTEEKIKKILGSIQQNAQDRDYDSLESALSSTLLNLEFDPQNVPLYGLNIEKYLTNSPTDKQPLTIETLQQILTESDKQSIEAKELAQLTIDLENCLQDPEVIARYLESNLVCVGDVIESNYEEYTKQLSRKMSSEARKGHDSTTDLASSLDAKNEDANADPMQFRCITRSGIQFFYDEEHSRVIWDIKSDAETEAIENKKRLTMIQMSSLVKKCNEMAKIKQSSTDITKLQELMKMLLAYNKCQTRFNHLTKDTEKVAKIQDFFHSLVGRNDFHNLMKGEQVGLPVILKFINILIPNDYDLQKMLQLSQMKSEVRNFIIKIQEKEARVKDLELLCGLLVQSKYSDRSSKTIPQSVTSGYLRQERIETLRFYGKVLYCLIMYEKYFAKLIYLLDKNNQADISSTILPIFDYISTPREEARALNCIIISLDTYIHDSKCLKLLTHGNPNPFKLVQECALYFKKDQFQSFLECFRLPINNLIEKGTETYSINPLHIYVDLKQKDAVLDITVEKVLEDQEVAKKLQSDIEKISDFVLEMLNALSSSVKFMPYMFRAIIRHIFTSEVIEEKHRLQMIANLLLGKILTQIITIPEQYKITDKQPNEIKEKQRKLMTQVATMITAIGMKQKFKGEHLATLDKFVLKKHSSFVSIIKEIVDIPDISEYYQVPRKSEFVEDNESVTLRIEKLINLHEILLKYKDELSPKNDDILKKLLADFGEPKFENFLKDPDVNAVTKREMSRKLVTLELVRVVKPLTNKKETPKYLMKDLKILFCQLLFAIDKESFTPSKVQQVLNHEWSEVEHDKHDSNNRYFKGISETKDISRTESIYSLDNLETIRSNCKELIVKLAKQGYFDEDPEYQQLIDEISSDIRSEHSHKIELRHQISLLTVTKNKLEETNTYLDKKIPFLDNYIASLKAGLNKNSKKRGKSKGVSSKGKSYAADKLMKKSIILKFQHPDVSNMKDVQIKFTAGQESNYQVSLIVIGSIIEETLISSSDIILKTYNKQTEFELFKGITFDTRELYKLLVNK